jgi:hypothetical protein
MSKQAAIKAITIISKCFRQAQTGSGEDFQVWFDMAVSALDDYPDPVLTALVDPKVGVVARCKFLPSISELIEIATEFRGKYSEIRQRETLARVPALPRTASDPEYPQEYRERMQARFAELIADLANAPDLWAEEGPARAKGDAVLKAERQRKSAAMIEAERDLAIEWIASNAGPQDLPKLSINALKTVGIIA